MNNIDFLDFMLDHCTEPRNMYHYELMDNWNYLVKKYYFLYLLRLGA